MKRPTEIVQRFLRCDVGVGDESTSDFDINGTLVKFSVLFLLIARFL